MEKKNKPDKSGKKLSFEFYSPDVQAQQHLDLYSYHIPAGFPSPAEDFLEKRLDLNEYLKVKNSIR